jgi:hypothetical protein
MTIRLELFKGLVEFRRPCEMAGALESGSGENVMKWCPGGRLVWQKSPVELQHAKKTEELTGSLGRVAVLKMGKKGKDKDFPSTGLGGP